eukprot:8095349-Pyramimonas_sp.AAC.1
MVVMMLLMMLMGMMAFASLVVGVGAKIPRRAPRLFLATLPAPSLALLGSGCSHGERGRRGCTAE